MIPTIAKECSEFLETCNNNLIVKNLPSKYQGFAKVKVRFGKSKNEFSKTFDEAFKENKYELHKSAIFAYTDINILPTETDLEPFYIFPINGYKFIYNPTVRNSLNEFSSLNINEDLITDLLKVSYKNDSLTEAFKNKCEIILYNIPYYYAIRTSILDDCSYII